mmetsp:Transcript_6291/g.39159  ORF Transcript_6291/g.39159 Transcript_6291/m.39159 type:complete len:96 (-) Transcript_6291:1843-2130(-)
MDLFPSKPRKVPPAPGCVLGGELSSGLTPEFTEGERQRLTEASKTKQGRVVLFTSDRGRFGGYCSSSERRAARHERLPEKVKREVEARGRIAAGR